MFVVFCYDVGKPRLARVLRTGRRYLHRVQNSVFEGMLTQAQLGRMKAELETLIDPERDSLIFYETEVFGELKRDRIGLSGSEAADGFL